MQHHKQPTTFNLLGLRIAVNQTYMRLGLPTIKLHLCCPFLSPSLRHIPTFFPHNTVRSGKYAGKSIASLEYSVSQDSVVTDGKEIDESQL